MDQEGDVYTSGGGKFIRFRVKTQELEELKASVPTVPGRETYNRVGAWAQDGNGNFYGGVSDGYLFRLDRRRCHRNTGKQQL